MSTLNGAVIGIGGIGKNHAQMLRDSGRVELVAICDANLAAKSIVEKDFSQAAFYTKPEEMFAKHKIDLVTVATPHNLHAPISIAALKAGANVIVEKPMATTYADAQAMVAAARAAKKVLTVFHNRRIDPWFLAAKSVIDDGLLGEVFEINIAIGGADAGNPTWRGLKEASGGVMFDWGVHLVDYALHFTDRDVKTVSGYLYRRPDSDPKRNEDHGSLQIRFANGLIANVTVSAQMYAMSERYRIYGTKGTLIDHWNWETKDKLKVHTKLSGGEPTTMEVQYRNTKWQDYYDNVVAHLLDGKPLLISDESAAKNINVLTTAERSAMQGGTPLPLA